MEKCTVTGIPLQGEGLLTRTSLQPNPTREALPGDHRQGVAGSQTQSNEIKLTRDEKHPLCVCSLAGPGRAKQARREDAKTGNGRADRQPTENGT